MPEARLRRSPSFNLDGVGRSLSDSYGGPRGLEFLLADASGDVLPLDRRALDRRRSLPERDVDGTRRRRDRARTSAGGCTPAPTARRRSPRRERLNRRELTIILAGLVLFLLAAAVVHRRVARPLARLGAEVRARDRRRRAAAGHGRRARARSRSLARPA